MTSARKGDTQGQPDYDDSAEVRLLAGGNPQILKGHGEGPVQAYIAAMPGWKRSLGEHLDSLIERAVPDGQKAVKYNEPFYGIGDDDVWFVSYRCFTNYVKLTFFAGTSLDPQPPKGSKVPGVRYFEIHEDDEVDEELLLSWFEQASQLPGEKI